MVRYCWLLTSQPPSARYPSPLPAPKAPLSDIFPDWQCAVSPTYTPVKPKPMPVMRLIITEASRTLPHALRTLRSCCADNTGQQPYPGLLTQIPPALERVLGPRLDQPGIVFREESTIYCFHALHWTMEWLLFLSFFRFFCFFFLLYCFFIICSGYYTKISTAFYVIFFQLLSHKHKYIDR